MCWEEVLRTGDGPADWGGPCELGRARSNGEDRLGVVVRPMKMPKYLIYFIIYSEVLVYLVGKFCSVLNFVPVSQIMNSCLHFVRIGFVFCADNILYIDNRTNALTNFLHLLVIII